MSLLRWRGVVAVGLSILHVVAAAEACSCGTPPTPERALREADLVFRGRVTNITPVLQSGSTTESSSDPMVVEFEVNRVWKGAGKARVSLWTARSEESCGYPFEVGREYFVYSTQGLRKPADNVPTLTTGLCTRTALIEGAEEDVTALGEGKEVAPEKQ